MNYSAITIADVANGPGVRCVLWVSGCEHQCPGCHNPQTWDVRSGKEFGHNELDIIMDQLAKPWCAGLTFSGGDPLHPANREEIRIIAKTAKKLYPAKTIWLWTGYLWEDVANDPVMNYVDVVVDGPYIEAQRNITLAWRGSRNQRVIDVKKSKVTGNAVLLRE